MISYHFQPNICSPSHSNFNIKLKIFLFENNFFYLAIEKVKKKHKYYAKKLKYSESQKMCWPLKPLKCA